ncbi:MAG: peptidyl-tRNA hydrolase, partial [Spirochaetia bacterium]|nr:peptidyl-tRNA hydrolase [Spirochaetia bacterium]
PRERLLVLVDDVAIPFGTLRLRPGGSDGGHNGLKNIDSLCGNGYARLRLGIGDAASPVPMESFVLEKFSPDEQKRLPALVGQMAECAATFIDKGVQEAMNLWNGKKL